jgi:WD40 repeat protein
MKKLILASLTGVIGACGGMAPQSLDVPAQKADASTVGQGDLGTGTAAETLDASHDSFDVLADATASGAEVGRVEVRPVDSISALWDLAPAEVAWPVDSPRISDAGGLDAGIVGERPRPTDGRAATCEDQVLSYDDKVLGAYMSTVNSLAFSPDGQRLAAGIEHSIAEWQVGGGTDGGAADGGAGGIDGGGGGVDGGMCSGVLRSCPASIDSLAYLPDGRLVGLFCGGAFIIFGCENEPVFFGTFAVSPVGQMVADAYSPIRLWDTTSGNLVRTLASGGASSLAFSPDGAILVGGIAGAGVRLWDVASGAELTNLPIAAPGTSVRVAVSPDGRWLGALSSAGLQIWSLRTYTSVAAFAVDPLATSFAFSRDGNSVITGGAKVNVYAVSDGSLLYQLGDRTYIVAVSPDGTRLAASGGAGVPVNLYCLY